MRKVFMVISIMFASVFLTSCSQSDMDGIILDISESQILLATEISLEEYDDIKDLSPEQIQEKDVLGDAYYGLVYLTYADAEKFIKGNKVEVWVDGPVMESYPLQAKAKRVLLK